jgi:hypothetical protein
MLTDQIYAPRRSHYMCCSGAELFLKQPFDIDKATFLQT